MTIAAKLYAIRGSEDGNVAIATSAGRAIEIAAEYVQSSQPYGDDDEPTPVEYDAAKLRAGLKRYHFAQIDGTWAHAEINLFYANQGLER